MPAEWERHARTWMCWPARADLWGEGLARARAAHAAVARAIARHEPVTMAARPQDVEEAARLTGMEIWPVALDDSWARDSGPTFLKGTSAKAAVTWRFNAWGGKYSPYDQDALFAGRVAQKAGVPARAAPLVCEGGAIHSDGQGTLITTEQCLLNPNRNPGMGRHDVERLLCDATGASRVIWLGSGFSDEETDGHVDNIACFVAPGRVLIGVPSSRSHPDFEPVMEAIRRLSEARDAQGRRIEVIELEQPKKPGRDWRGRLLQTSYINFYLPNGGVVMPAFGDSNDEKARAVLADCFPGRDILQLDAQDIVAGGGGIHCITQQEPA
jgi:agmatine deiminase